MDPLPRIDTDIEAWVDAQLDRDPPKRNRMWRYRATGMTRAEAIATAPIYRKLDLDLPSREVEIVRWAARQHGLPVRGFFRAAVATAVELTGADLSDYPALDASPRLPWT